MVSLQLSQISQTWLWRLCMERQQTWKTRAETGHGRQQTIQSRQGKGRAGQKQAEGEIGQLMFVLVRRQVVPSRSSAVTRPWSALDRSKGGTFWTGTCQLGSSVFATRRSLLGSPTAHHIAFCDSPTAPSNDGSIPICSRRFGFAAQKLHE